MSVVGLLAPRLGIATGVIALCDKAFLLARTASNYRSSPNDVTKLLAMLLNESEKMYIWSLEAATRQKVEQDHSSTREASDELSMLIGGAIARQVEQMSLAQRQARDILDRYSPSDIAESPEYGVEAAMAAVFARADSNLGGHGGYVHLLNAKVKQKQMELFLQTRVSVGRQVLSVVKPWDQSDQDDMKEIVHRLKYWNDEFAKSVNRNDQRLLRDEASSRVMNEINGNLRVLEVMAELAEDGSVSEDIALSASLSIQVLLSEPSADQASSSIARSRLRMRDSPTGSIGVVIDETSGDGNAATVFVEWLDYSGLSYDQTQIASRRIDTLCRLLNTTKPEKLIVMPTLGFVNDRSTKRFGILSSVAPDHEVLTLRRILAARDSYRRPSLEERFSFARRMAWAVLELHKSRWLHKGLNSASLIFKAGRKLAGSQHQILEKPGLDLMAVGGFQYARPVGNEEVSLPVERDAIDDVALYHHAEVRRNLKSSSGGSGPGTHTKYQAYHDIYSLGVVLIELALWKGIRDLRLDASDADNFSRDLVTVAKDSLPYTMGKNYADIVARCLKGPGPALSLAPSGGSSLACEDNFTINWFFYDVVRPLDDCLCGA